MPEKNLTQKKRPQNDTLQDGTYQYNKCRRLHFRIERHIDRRKKRPIMPQQNMQVSYCKCNLCVDTAIHFDVYINCMQNIQYILLYIFSKSYKIINVSVTVCPGSKQNSTKHIKNVQKSLEMSKNKLLFYLFMYVVLTSRSRFSSVITLNSFLKPVATTSDKISTYELSSNFPGAMKNTQDLHDSYIVKN